jgi:L-threonylcarbamoyladenylate synthase
VAGGQDSVGCAALRIRWRRRCCANSGRQGRYRRPSANKFGHVSPTTAEHVREEFGSDADSLVDYVLDGGQSEVGIESTIVDLSRIDTHGPVLLRPGQISADRIAAVLGVPLATPDATAPRASGTLDAHYAAYAGGAGCACRAAALLGKLAGIGQKVA